MSNVSHATAVSMSTPTSRRTAPLWRTGVTAALAAALATTVIAAAARGAGVSLKIDGGAIPLPAFAQMTLVGAVLGLVLALVLRRRAARPRRTFVVATAALTALSLVPDLAYPAAASTRAVLMATHLVAAAIVIPLLAARLPARTR